MKASAACEVPPREMTLNCDRLRIGLETIDTSYDSLFTISHH